MKTPQRPPMFAILRRHGITHQDIANGFGITRPAVTQWASGVRQLAPSVAQDLDDLRALIAEHVQRGQPPRDALQAWRPRSVVTEGGAWQSPPVAVSSGPTDIPDPIAKAFLEAKDDATRTTLLLQNIMDQLEVYRDRELSQLTMADILQMRNLAMALQALTSTIAQRKGQELGQSGEGKS
jgi:hypothetical protein